MAITVHTSALLNIYRVITTLLSSYTMVTKKMNQGVMRCILSDNE